MKFPFDPHMLEGAMAFFFFYLCSYIFFSCYIAWIRISFAIVDGLTK